MNDLTQFGVAIRQLRLQLRTRMYDMAKALGCSPAFLSSVENGHRPIPNGFVEKIIDVYRLSDNDATKLHKAYTVTMKRVPTENLNGRQKECVATFARAIPHMPQNVFEAIEKKIQTYVGNEE